MNDYGAFSHCPLSIKILRDDVHGWTNAVGAWMQERPSCEFMKRSG